ncbi:MAG: hypothetical protein WBK55_08115 [Alphaproteobacteria bacterium]
MTAYTAAAAVFTLIGLWALSSVGTDTAMLCALMMIQISICIHLLGLIANRR